LGLATAETTFSFVVALQMRDKEQRIAELKKRCRELEAALEALTGASGNSESGLLTNRRMLLGFWLGSAAVLQDFGITR
jgi:hypothetical protein